MSCRHTRIEASSDGGQDPEGAVASWMECLHSTTLELTTQNLQSLMFTNTSADTDAISPLGSTGTYFCFAIKNFRYRQ
jgi:hypothetical protein